MRSEIEARNTFIALWAALALIKCAIAARLPLFVDEAFYWQESRRLAWAYSDLPGMSAWLIRIGAESFGDGLLGVRASALLLSACMPWLVVRIARREVGGREGWLAGCAALLLPLLGSLGLLALPDVAMTFATLLCLDAATRLLRGSDNAAALQLAAGLAIGALSHYRFVAVIGAGGVALMLLPQGRRLLRDPRVLLAAAAGALAWLPLLLWNLQNADAGLRFQLVDRHPWALHADGLAFLPVQMALVTPLLFLALLAAAWRFRADPNPALRLLAHAGAVVVAGFFVLGFFADTERVSFHWPLPGYVALLPLLPSLLAGWRRPLRVATWTLAAAGTFCVLGYYAAVSVPAFRAQLAGTKAYPANFAGWGELASAVRARLAAMPPGTRIVADNFKTGAELGFALGDPRIAVLAHPLNAAHGRAPQLRLWGQAVDRREDLGDGPLLLAVAATDVKFSALVAHYQDLCAAMGPLGPPQVVEVDRGAKRFLLFAPPGRRDAGCVSPAIAHVDAPRDGARVGREFEVSGWALKDGAGVTAVAVTLDGRPLAQARYGGSEPWPQRFYDGRSTDPNHPHIAFRARIDARGLAPGRYRLGIEVAGADGSREPFAGPAIEVAGND